MSGANCTEQREFAFGFGVDVNLEVAVDELEVLAVVHL